MVSAVINVAPEGNLSRYLQEIRKFPMLAPDEELALSKAWRDNEDMDAAHKLVTSHLRLVAKIAMGYPRLRLAGGRADQRGQRRHDAGGEAVRPGPGLPPGDLRHVVDPCRHPGIHPPQLVAGEDGKRRAAQKKLFFNLRRLKGQMQAIEDGDLKPEHVAKISRVLQVPEQDVVSMNRRLAAPDHSLNAPVRADSEGRVAGLAGGRGSEPGGRTCRPRRTDRAAGAVGQRAQDAERAGAPHSDRASPQGQPDDAGGAVAAIQHLPRAGAADRGARVRRSCRSR